MRKGGQEVNVRISIHVDRNNSQQARHAPEKKPENNGTYENGDATMRSIARVLLIIETLIIILGVAALLVPGTDLLGMRLDNVNNQPKDQSRIVPGIGSIEQDKSCFD